MDRNDEWYTALEEEAKAVKASPSHFELALMMCYYRRRMEEALVLLQKLTDRLDAKNFK